MELPVLAFTPERSGRALPGGDLDVIRAMLDPDMPVMSEPELRRCVMERQLLDLSRMLYIKCVESRDEE